MINDRTKFLQFHNEGISINSNMELLSSGNLFNVDAFKIKNIMSMVFNFIQRLHLK